MKHIQKSQTYRETLADSNARKKTFGQLPYPTRKKIFKELGMQMTKKEDRENLSSRWGKHRQNRAMYKEAEEMVTADEEEAEATLDAAVAGAAGTAPVPQTSNYEDLKEATKAALVAATKANQAAAKSNQAATSAHQGLDKLAGVVEKQGKHIGEQSKHIGEQSKHIGEQSKQISDLKDISANHGDRLNNHEGRLNNHEGRFNNHEGRLNNVEESVRVLSGQYSRDQRSQQQQQNDPNAQLLAVGASAGGNGYASPPRAPSSPDADKKMPPSPPSPSFGSDLGSAGGSNGIAIPSPPPPSSTLDSGFTSSGSSGGNSDRSVGINGSNGRGSTDVVSTAPAFGSTFLQYKGFQSTTPGGGGGFAGDGGFATDTGVAVGSGGGDDDDVEKAIVSKELFGKSTTGGGGFFSSSHPTALTTTAAGSPFHQASTMEDAASNGGATATDVDIFGKSNVVGKPSSEIILYSPPLNTALPTLKAVENMGGKSKWGQRSSMAKYKIVFDSTNSSARLTIHDNGFHLVLNHNINPQIKLEPYNKRDDCWVWTARDYSRNDSGTVTTFQLRFADDRVAAAFGEKFKEAQEMTTK